MLQHLRIFLLGAVVLHPAYEKMCRCRALAQFDQADWLNEARWLGGWQWQDELPPLQERAL